MTKKTNTTTALSSVSTTSLQIGTREVVSIAVSRIEGALRKQLATARAAKESLEADKNKVSKKLSKAISTQVKALAAPVTAHLEALTLMNTKLSVKVESELRTPFADEFDCGERKVTGHEIVASVSLCNRESNHYHGSCCTIQDFVTAPEDAVTECIKEIADLDGKIEETVEAINKLGKDLSNLPSAERQFTARMAEKVLSGSTSGKAMLAEVAEAIKAMGFGNLQSLT